MTAGHGGPARPALVAALVAALALVAVLAGCSDAPPPAPAGTPAPVQAPASFPAPAPASASSTAAPGPVPVPAGVRYAALGDSYTSSPSTGPSAGPPPGCQRSTNDYPHVAAARIAAQLTDVSCSGAVTADLAGPQTTSTGTNAPQLDAVRRDTQLVSVQIGGNDIGFSEIVRACIDTRGTGTPCRDRYTAGGTDRLRDRIDELGPVLADALAQVRRRAPQARVLVVGYPSLLPVEGPGCFPSLPYTPGDVVYLRGVVTALNREIADRAGAAGATFVDTATPTAGHDMCQVTGERWIEGLLPQSPAAPVHPNALGQEALARAVVAAVGAT